MRILIVSDAWLPQINGVVRTYQRMTTMLLERGYTVDVIGPDRFRTVPCPTYPEIRLAIDAWYRLSGKIEAFAPDAIHIATEGPLGQAAKNFCVKRNVPFTTSFHTRFPEYVHARCGLPLTISYAWLRRFHQHARRILVPTESMRKTLHGYGMTHTEIWGRGVDTSLFVPAKTSKDRDFLNLPRPIYAYVGRVAVEKNIRQFLDLDLGGSKLVVGDGPQLGSLQSAYPQVSFVGAKEGLDLVKHYQAADVFVFPSLTDTFGLVLIEALACGVPVAALPVTGPLDVIGMESNVGILDTDLGNAARKALSLSRRDCSDFAVNFSWDRSLDQFLSSLSPVAAP